MIFVAGLVMAISACAGVPAEQTRLTEARALAQQRAEALLDLTFESLSTLGVMDDIDCNAEAGVDAKQCNAFVARMSGEMTILRAEERPQALAEAAPAIEALALAIASLSDADIATFRENVTPPLRYKIFKPLTENGQRAIAPADQALHRVMTDLDQKIGDRMQALISEILAELMADPSLQTP
jgi:hypothetical protein